MSSNALSEKDGSVSIHERNIKFLVAELFKVSKNLAPSQMHEIFKLKDQSQYNLRYNSLFSRPLVKSINKGTENCWTVCYWSRFPRQPVKGVPYKNCFLIMKDLYSRTVNLKWNLFIISRAPCFQVTLFFVCFPRLFKFLNFNLTPIRILMMSTAILIVYIVLCFFVN